MLCWSVSFRNGKPSQENPDPFLSSPNIFYAYTHLKIANKRQPSSIPLSIPLVWDRVVEVRLSGAVGSQRGWLSSVSLHLTPYQHEVTEQTRQPSPPTCLPSPPCSISLMVQWAWGCRVWAAVCRMTIDRAEGQGNWETRCLAWAPALLAQRHFRSVSAARHRPNVAKITVKVKGYSLCVFLLTQIYINKKNNTEVPKISTRYRQKIDFMHLKNMD